MYKILKESVSSKITLSNELWSDLQQIAQELAVKKGDYLLRNNEVCHYGYFIRQGSFMHTYINEVGKEYVIGFHVDEVYRYITSPQSFFSGHISNFEIIALENSKVLAFHKKDLEQLSYKYPEFHNYYHQLTSDGFLFLYLFSTLKLATSSLKFIEKIYTDYPVFLQRIPDKFIARFMGISVEWFCKLKKKVFKN